VTASPPAPSAWASRPVAAARSGLLAVLVLAPVAALVAGLLAGGSGVRGALLGVCVPGVVVLTTLVAVEAGARRSPTTFAALLLGSYLVKLVLVGLLLFLLSGIADTARTALGVTAVVGLMLALVVEARVVTATRAPYVEPTGS